ncbi:MAG: hypothetical protein ACTSYS_07455 [Promethearchaeota archaeon]
MVSNINISDHLNVSENLKKISVFNDNAGIRLKTSRMFEIRGNFACIADGPDRLEIINITELTNSTKINFFQKSEGFATKVEIIVDLPISWIYL